MRIQAILLGILAAILPAGDSWAHQNGKHEVSLQYLLGKKGVVVQLFLAPAELQKWGLTQPSQEGPLAEELSAPLKRRFTDKHQLSINGRKIRPKLSQFRFVKNKQDQLSFSLSASYAARVPIKELIFSYQDSEKPHAVLSGPRGHQEIEFKTKQNIYVWRPKGSKYTPPNPIENTSAQSGSLAGRIGYWTWLFMGLLSFVIFRKIAFTKKHVLFWCLGWLTGLYFLFNYTPVKNYLPIYRPVKKDMRKTIVRSLIHDNLRIQNPQKNLFNNLSEEESSWAQAWFKDMRTDHRFTRLAAQDVSFENFKILDSYHTPLGKGLVVKARWDEIRKYAAHGYSRTATQTISMDFLLTHRGAGWALGDIYELEVGEDPALKTIVEGQKRR